MRLAACAGLRVITSDGAAVVLQHPYTGTCWSIEPAAADLLALLIEPIAIEDLVRPDGGVPSEVVDRLLAAGLLVDVDGLSDHSPMLLGRPDPTFMGSPYGSAGDPHFAIIGVACDHLSDTGHGAAEGPAAIRLSSTPPHYDHAVLGRGPRGWFDAYAGRAACGGIHIADLGDIIHDPGADPRTAGDTLRDAVLEVRRHGGVPLILGGDHSLTAWALEGLPDERVSVLHLDAHTDLAPAGPTLPTNGSVMHAVLALPQVTSLVTAGVRGHLDAPQTSQRANHRVVYAAEARAMGPERLVDALPVDCPVYVSLDVDVLDQREAGGTNSPVPGGFTFGEVRDILEAVATRRTVIGADFVELSPARDRYQVTARMVAHLVMSLMSAAAAARGSQ